MKFQIEDPVATRETDDGAPAGTGGRRDKEENLVSAPTQHLTREERRGWQDTRRRGGGIYIEGGPGHMTRGTRAGVTCQTARTVRARTRGHVDLRINSHTQSTSGGDDYEMSTGICQKSFYFNLPKCKFYGHKICIQLESVFDKQLTEAYLVAGKSCPVTGPNSHRVLDQVNPLWLWQDCDTPRSTFTSP